MGFFKKLGEALVEEVPAENEEIFMEQEPVKENPVNANLEEVHINTLVDDIYFQNQLSDRSRSIFKVDELLQSMPKDMVTESKKAAVLSALSVFGLSLAEVTEDGEKRIITLENVKEIINRDSHDLISAKEAKIEELKKEIAELEKEMEEEQKKAKISNEAITMETERILNLIKFIDGGTK